MKQLFLPNLSFSLGQITITPFFWALAAAFFISSFSFWRRLKEDLPQEEIYKLILLSVSVSLGLFFLGGNIGLGVFFAYIGLVLTVVVFMRNIKRNFWEGLDASSLTICFFLFFGGGGVFLSTANLFSLIYSGLGLLGLLLFWRLKKNYRSFLWYKSGKTGFLFWAVSFYAFCVLFILAFFEKTGLYLAQGCYLGISLVSLGIIYWRSERKLKEDFKFLKTPWFKK